MKTRFYSPTALVAVTALVAAVSLPASAGVYTINFVIDPSATLLPHPDYIHMVLTTDGTLHMGFNGFMGYQVQSFSGTSTENNVVEALNSTPLALQFAPGSPFNFYPILNTGPFLIADNLFDPSGYPNGNFVSAAGIGFETASGEQYQLSFDPIGSVSGGRTVLVQVVPEPSTLLLVGLAGLLGHGLRRSKPSA